MAEYRCLLQDDVGSPMELITNTFLPIIEIPVYEDVTWEKECKVVHKWKRKQFKFDAISQRGYYIYWRCDNDKE